jgi:hypothetical protein
MGLVSGIENDGLVFNCALFVFIDEGDLEEGPAIGLTGPLGLDGSGRYPCLILSAVSLASIASINGLRFD